MKKRILFVDDEPLELKGLQRLLQKMQSEWDLVFVGSGAAALETLAATPCAAIVTDMRMPGMNGVELLNEVGKQHPGIIRVILSSFADKELIMECVWGTHQFLAKPCDSETLIATLTRSLALDTWLSSEHLKGLVSRMPPLPSLPSLYFEVVRELESPNCSAEKVGEIISKDLAITAKVLQMVNSAFFGLHRQITNATEAVMVLGTETVKSLILCIHAFNHFDKVKTQDFSIDQLWAHSMEVAAAAKRIALHERLPAKAADEIFTAGLLHDIGKLVLASNLPTEFRAAQALARAKTISQCDAEQEVLGTTHAEVGAYLLARWGLPAPMVEAAALHHHPSRGAGRAFSPLTAVHVANVLEHEKKPDENNPVPAKMDANYLVELDLADRLPVWAGETAPSASAGAPASEGTTVVPLPARASSGWRTSTLLQAAAVLIGLLAISTVFLWQRSTATRPERRAAAPIVLAKAAPAPPVVSVKPAVAEPVVPPAAVAKPAPALVAKLTPPPAATPAPVLAPAPVAKPAPKIVEAPAIVEPPTPPAEFPALKLQGIFMSKASSTALINGKVLVQGEKIEGVRVKSIQAQKVTLEFAGQDKSLVLGESTRSAP